MRGKKKIGILAVFMAVMLAGCGIFGGFDAKGYVQAVLGQTFQGDVTKAVEVMEGTTSGELFEQYEKEIDAFVQNNLTVGVEMDSKLYDKYIRITKEIFRAMRYNVSAEKKISKTEYEVSVEIQPSDVFVLFTEKVETHFAELIERVNNGEYQGTEEEINLKMQTDLITDAYEFLESSCKEMQYGQKETVVLKVKGDEKKVFSVAEEEVYNLIAKILRLDEIQG